MLLCPKPIPSTRRKKSEEERSYVRHNWNTHARDTIGLFDLLRPQKIFFIHSHSCFEQVDKKTGKPLCPRDELALWFVGQRGLLHPVFLGVKDSFLQRRIFVRPQAKPIIKSILIHLPNPGKSLLPNGGLPSSRQIERI